ncbi:MAG: hypothetical protein ACQER9_01485 [Nanobdellota archaeon]
MKKKLVKKVDPFICYNGEMIDSVKNLALSLENMEYETFQHHVNKEKNDFSTWISGAVKDKKLASLIRDIKEQPQMKNQIMKYILLNI